MFVSSMMLLIAYVLLSHNQPLRPSLSGSRYRRNLNPSARAPSDAYFIESLIYPAQSDILRQYDRQSGVAINNNISPLAVSPHRLAIAQVRGGKP